MAHQRGLGPQAHAEEGGPAIPSTCFQASQPKQGKCTRTLPSEPVSCTWCHACRSPASATLGDRKQAPPMTFNSSKCLTVLRGCSDEHLGSSSSDTLGLTDSAPPGHAHTPSTPRQWKAQSSKNPSFLGGNWVPLPVSDFLFPPLPLAVLCMEFPHLRHF